MIMLLLGRMVARGPIQCGKTGASSSAASHCAVYNSTKVGDENAKTFKRQRSDGRDQRSRQRSEISGQKSAKTQTRKEQRGKC